MMISKETTGTRSLVILIFSMIAESDAWSWGERGHHIVGAIAARSMRAIVLLDKEGLALKEYFVDRDIMLGHLSNLPDISWRASIRTRIAKLNSPHHYFGPERILGIPTDEALFIEKMRALPADYATIKSFYDGKTNALPGADPSKPFWTYEDLGVTPWRSQQLYDLMVRAWTCAKGKDGAPQPGMLSDQPFQLPTDGLGHTTEPPLPTYVCRPEVSRRADIHAAMILGGILSHFIGDQGQPYHPTADYDGWVTGNGGIHSYFESDVVQALDERLNADVAEFALSKSFRENTWKRVGTDLSAPNSIARLQILLGADSHSLREAVRQIDDQVAILKITLPDGTITLAKSAILPWGAHASGQKRAQRLSAETPAVLAAFRPMIVGRLAVSAVVLSHVWLSAWEAGGKPSLVGYPSYALPYPLDVPFIWPDFDLDALMRSKPSVESSQIQKNPKAVGPKTQS